MNVLVIDGQGGRMGALLVKKLREASPELDITAVGTNSAATAAMLKAGADRGATGENPAARLSAEADVIAGPIGILAAHAILGEVTPEMAEAVGGSRARKVLVPVAGCGIQVAGVREGKLSDYIDEAVRAVLLGTL